MSVKIRMKRMGRKHRAYYRICAADHRSPRDGKVIEEIGTYDPSIADTDARVTLNHERLAYWLSVGAQPSEHVAAFIKKYGQNGTHLDQQAAARERLAMPKIVPPTPEPVFVAKSKAEIAAEAAAAEAAAVAAAAAAAEVAAAEAAEATESPAVSTEETTEAAASE
jgi:small subunit ribosomal protein S16